MTDYVLEERPNTCGTPQYRTPRRQPLSGVVDVHTAESMIDRSAPYMGAENVANFIVGRCDYGSYHVLVEPDGPVYMAPDDAETWHVAATAANGYGNNSHAWGISAACRATDWDPDDPWTQQTIDVMGREIAAFWTRNGFDELARNPRWITKGEADRMVPGLILHGDHQPWDRTDAWKNHPRRTELDEMLLAAIRRHSGGVAPQPDGSMSMSDVQTILDGQRDLSRRIDAQDETLGAWMKDTRVILENAMGAVTLTVPGDKKQWLLVAADVPGGVAKVHVADPATLALLVKAQVVRQGQAGDQFKQVVELTDPVEIAKLNSLPILGS